MTTKATRLLSIAILAVTAIGSSTFAAPSEGAKAIPDRLLVKFHPGTPALARKEALHNVNARMVDQIAQIDVKILAVHDTQRGKVLEALRRNPNVEFVEEDMLVPMDATPNDYWYPAQWHLKKIGAPAAWDVTTGSPEVIVAILDSGVESQHPDLAANIIPGWNFYDNNSNTADTRGHGTGVAGTVAAISNNVAGVASVAWNVRIMPVRIADPSGVASFSTIAKGITYAADQGARVANISAQVSESSTVSSAASYFRSKRGIVTSSAGNEARFISAKDNPNIVTVSATQSSDAPTSFTNTGNHIDLAAPGSMIRSTISGGGYGDWSGTSFSAPIVASVAALIISANPSLSAEEIESILFASADDLGAAGWDTTYGWGRVNAARAVQMAAGKQATDTTPPTASVTSPAGGTTLSGTVTIGFTSSDSSGISRIAVLIDGKAISEQPAASGSVMWNTTGVSDGTRSISVQAWDLAGNTAVSPTVSVSVKNTVVVVADTQSPSVSIVSPSSGSRVAKNVKVYVQASDDKKIALVKLFVNGKLLSSSTTSNPTFTWNTAKVAKGKHALVATAEDAAGNVGTSLTVEVTK